MVPELYSEVRLLTERFANEGVNRNATGYVIEVYEDGNCEVEFSNSDGTTYAQIVAKPDDLEVIPTQS